jgi:hypothetical protein
MPRGIPKSKNHESDRNKGADLDMGASSMRKKKRLDSTMYEEARPDMKFCWVNDTDGDIDRHIEAGFEPVERKTHSGRSFEGLTDRTDDKWVRSVGGTHDGGATMYVYLLMIDKDRYHAIKIKPNEERNKEIQQAMGLAAREGKADSSARDGSDIATYAPNLPTGGQGFSQIAGEDGFNKLTQR